ncbi:MAG: ribosome recycling factor [Omnitrophica bacterium RIFCSPHIGHO2_02_FULL_49_9]|nr:MAG: ribosome recycling factor [Omnitrophica bacterium RIFCSPHIGHO2_02_FULL_49_9]
MDQLKPILSDAQHKMQRATDATVQEFHNLRTGRASIMMVETIKVDYYNTQTQLKSLASLTTPDARTILIQPWDPSSLGAIEKAIQTSELGLTPNNDGKIIRIQLAQLTDERRTELDKVVRKIAEEGRVSIRNIRHAANDTIKKLERTGVIGEDVSKAHQKKVQDLTDKFIRSVDEALSTKEREIKEG